MTTVRAVSLSNYVEVARFVGLDPYAMLRAARINPEWLEDPERRLPAAAVGDLLQATVDLSGRPDIGLLLAEQRTFASLGAISVMLEHQPNPRAMIEGIIRFQRLLNDIVDLRLEDDGEVAMLHVDLDWRTARPVATEYAVAVLYRALDQVMRGRWRAECIHFTHRAPADLAPYRRVFPLRIEFEARFDGFSCASPMLDVPNPAAHPLLAAHAERLLELVPVTQPDNNIVERARGSIQILIHEGQASIDRVADMLGVHPRTLQRLLEKEGWTFAHLLNTTRREVAERYLTGSYHSIEAVSHLAGYSTQSAFTRWFAKEYGQSPAAWRNAHRGMTGTA